jgi:glycosyltransferase 2 family protein
MSINWRKGVRQYKSYIFITLLVFLTLRVIIPQLDDLRSSLASLSSANFYWVLIALIIFFLSVPISTFQYMVLVLKPIKFYLTFKVQMATLFVAKLLPQSVGTISLNVYYLLKNDHTASQAAAVMTIDGICSGIAYMFLMIAALLASPLSLSGLGENIDISLNLILFILILLLGAIYLITRLTRIGQRIKKAWADLKQNFKAYKQKPMSIIAGIICNGLSSLTSIFVLWASAQAFGIELSFSGALLAYTFGNIAATLIPTPGGIGAVEAGVYSGLVLVGVDGPDATLITLLYRLITYWIPILPGYYFFWNLRKDLLNNYKLRKNYS